MRLYLLGHSATVAVTIYILRHRESTLYNTKESELLSRLFIKSCLGRSRLSPSLAKIPVLSTGQYHSLIPRQALPSSSYNDHLRKKTFKETFRTTFHDFVPMLCGVQVTTCLVGAPHRDSRSSDIQSGQRILAFSNRVIALVNALKGRRDIRSQS